MASGMMRDRMTLSVALVQSRTFLKTSIFNDSRPYKTEGFVTNQDEGRSLHCHKKADKGTRMQQQQRYTIIFAK